MLSLQELNLDEKILRMRQVYFVKNLCYSDERSTKMRIIQMICGKTLRNCHCKNKIWMEKAKGCNKYIVLKICVIKAAMKLV